MTPSDRRTPRRRAFAALLAVSALALPLAACGDDETETDVPEGEPLELGDMAYDVQISRFLNPDAPDDAEYLEGAPPLQAGEQYFGVFMEITNEGEEANVVPTPFKIVDTRGNVFVQEELDNPFALEAGAPIEPDETVPGPETPAANGPIEGALVLFALEETAVEDRPLKLEVPGPDGVGEIELDL
jgi:hypothetical protein